MTVYVCFDKDIECGDRPDGWCLACPKRGLLQVAVAPHAAAHAGPTQMRPATHEEHALLRRAAVRNLVPHPAAERVRKALALVESEPDTVGLHSAACELREALRTLGVALPDGAQQHE